MQAFRIIGVWLIALILTALLFGGIKGFLFVFLIYGMFMTLPALVVLAITSWIEGILVRQDHPLMAAALGPAMGIVIPVLLFVIAPNKSNALSAISMLVWITIGTGVLWALSYFWVSRRSRSQLAEENFD